MTHSSPPSRSAAFFDMDKTLLSGSSPLLLARYLRQRGQLPLADVRRILAAVLRYKLGALDLLQFTRAVVSDLTGHVEADHIRRMEQWFTDSLIEYVAAEGDRWIQWHRSQGHRVALITASPSYTAQQLADHLGIAGEDIMATRFEVHQGRFTGRLIEPMVYGQGKRMAAQAYAAAHDIALQDSYFYTDSIEDLALLLIVGHPVAVNPDRELQKLAQASGWPILRFY